MRDRILHNERYGALEISRAGIIKDSNGKARIILHELCKKYSIDNLSGIPIDRLQKGEKGISGNNIDPVLVFSSLEGIQLIDSFIFHETGSVIVRFTLINDELYPFFSIVRNSSSAFFELDKDLNFILASDSFFSLSKLDCADLYGRSLSFFTADKDYNKFRSSVSGMDSGKFIEIDEFYFSFDGNISAYQIEVYPAYSSADELNGYLCFIPDSSIHKKCRELELAVNRMNEAVSFTGTVSHDCNNALTAVLGNISLARMEAHGNAELEELLTDAESAALKIKNLTEKLGTFIRSMKSQAR